MTSKGLGGLFLLINHYFSKTTDQCLPWSQRFKKAFTPESGSLEIIIYVFKYLTVSLAPLKFLPWQ